MADLRDLQGDLKTIYPHRYIEPRLHSTSLVVPGAHVIGDVTMGQESSLWFNSILRGDVNYIRVGDRTNIQDLTMVHVSYKANPTIIGNDVTVGHACVLHACTIKDFALIGMGSLILDEAEIGEYVLLGAGSLVTQKTKIPPGTKAFGRPAKVVGDLTEKEMESLKFSAAHYVKLAKTYLSATRSSSIGK